MTDQSIGDTEVLNISEKLETFQQALTKSERALLSGIFSIAADAIRPSPEGRGSTSLVSEDSGATTATVSLDPPVLPLSVQFQQQFKGAFTPDPPDVIRPMTAVVIPALPQDPPHK